jgi:hypothetical protein
VRFHPCGQNKKRPSGPRFAQKVYGPALQPRRLHRLPREKPRLSKHGLRRCYLRFFSQRWFASVQEVLQADWHEVWHSPQPVFALFAFNVPFTMVLTCFIPLSSVCLVFT